MNYSVVIPAAGQGKRMKAGRNKQFLKLAGEPLIVHTLRLFENDSWCENIILVANKTEHQMMWNLAKEMGFQKISGVICGGEERQQSVKNGIDSLHKEQIVLVHDGARPFITVDVIHRLVETAMEKRAVTVAVPVKDTIKRVKKGKVVDTLNREELWQIQTPQAFQLSLLQEAHTRAKQEGMIGTDDASLVEWLGHEVCVIEGDYQNIKLTTPDDMLLAEAILQKRELGKS
ncbi:2-C-methyl-D-erythritol 4-phosphate cytidylyltransferase [Halalkalibacter kiskunsagensis]|uniref:2-C-methyl-D-erythritol 4-phosphate cytidylyltransferase n=1 Tax=Halalkalibacter kiskunsagensis TaxID=1548599 RepID=A0ABV6KA11_9BACI